MEQTAHTKPSPTVPWPPAMPPHVHKHKAPGNIPLDGDLVHHLLRRVTYGPTDALVAQVHTTGVAHWLDQQLTPGHIDDSACNRALARKFPLLSTSSLGLRRHLESVNREYAWDGMEQLSQATLMRAVVSKKQLFEQVVEFWNNHFNVTCPSDKVWSTRHVHDRVVIRKHALGRFEDLLLATATSPAMLFYLDNAESQGRMPNENYGRELLELHTLGVGNYSERDIHQSALALTGWSVQDDESDTFAYKPGYRYTGPVSVKGWHHKNSDPGAGVAVGTSYLRYLAHHPDTARRVAHKLALHFVSDNPSQALVARMASTFLRHDTQIVPVLRVMFASTEFWSSLGAKVRRPYEWVTATMRTLGYTPTADRETDDWASLVWHLGSLGHAPLAWNPPNGYPDTAGYWESTAVTLGLWQSSLALVQGWWAGGKKGVHAPDVTIAGFHGLPAAPTAGQLVDAMSKRLVGHYLAPAHRAAVLGYYDVPAGRVPPDWKLDHGPIQTLAALILSSPVRGLR